MQVEFSNANPCEEWQGEPPAGEQSRQRAQGAGMLCLTPGRARMTRRGQNVEGTPSRRLRVDELSAVGRENEDPELRALEIAILVEETLDIALADEVLDAGHLGTPEAVRRVVDGLGREF